MKKTLIILTVVALLGILAASTASPSSKQNMNATQATANSKSTSGGSTSSNNSGPYKDGSYVGTTSSNQFDQIQVAVVVKNGKITGITTPTLYGDTGHSTQINSYAVPYLISQAISAQGSSIDGVSGASYTTQAYTDSLQSALDQAKA
jgi:uncharacterized protein with FMN-binding domain